MSAPSNQPNPPAGAPPAASYPPPAGPPPGGAPGQPASQDPNAPPAPGGYPPPGGYQAPGYPPPPGAPYGYPPYQYPGYPPAPGAPPPGQYPAPGAPPPGQYAAPGAPPPGQYPGYYPPYPGYYYPPPPGAPGAPGTPGAPPAAPGTPAATGAPGAAAPTAPTPGAPPPGAPGAWPQAYPPPGAYPPAPGSYPGYAPQYGAPPSPGAPSTAQAYPPQPEAPVPGFYPPPAGPTPTHGRTPSSQLRFGSPAPATQESFFYLGVAVPDPAVPPAMHGTQKVPGYDPTHDFNEIQHAAAVNVGVEHKVTRVLINLDVFQMDALNDYAVSKTGKTLSEYLSKFAAEKFPDVSRGLALGPLGYDVELAHKAVIGLGTNEWVLIELLLNRPAPEIRLLKTAYKLRYGKDLADHVRDDLSGSAKQMFVMALNAQRPPDSAPLDQNQVRTDVLTLVQLAKTKNDEMLIQTLVNRSTPHLQAVITEYNKQGQGLSAYIKKKYTGVVRDGLLYIVHGVKTKRDGRGEWRDAKLLEATMKGLGTKDSQLIYRIIRAHWDYDRFQRIKTAYQNRYKKPLVNRVKGETSGPYRDILVAILESKKKAGMMPSAPSHK